MPDQGVLAHRGQDREDVLVARHQLRLVVAEESVGSRGQCRGHRAGNGHHRAPTGRRPGDGVTGPGTVGGLDDDGAARQRRDQPVATQEAQSRRMLARGQLGHQDPAPGDRLVEPRMRRRVDLVDAARQHCCGDRVAGAVTRREGPAVGRRVDPVRRP
ncbi:hypothetical protein SDC9_168437 [bioreactor metagenome]|uniref:Uncharacterized protein n=1 Tax=bioreactor metagenome TaxID=1076179 RepID=A0A645G2I8_9ZZZZ